MHWHRLTKEGVGVPSIDMFKVRLSFEQPHNQTAFDITEVSKHHTTHRVAKNLASISLLYCVNSGIIENL